MSKIDKFLIIGLSIKAATGVIGGSMILAESKPYLTLGVLAVGAISSEIVNYVQRKQSEFIEEETE